MATQVASLFAKLELDDSGFVGGMQRASGTLAGLGSGIQNTGQNIRRMGTQLTLLTAPLALGLGGAVHAAMNFDEAMTNAQSILGLTREEMAGLRDEVLAIGGDSRAGPQAAAEAFYTIVSGVQDASTHMAILNNSIALAEAGNAQLMTTTDGLVAVMNAYQFAAEDAQFVSDVYTRTVQMGVGTMDQFVSAMAPAASLANTLEIGFDELAGSTAFLTTQGTSASESVTQLMGIMTAFLKPNESMQDALEAMGVESGQAAIEQYGLQGAVAALSDALGGSTGAMAEAMGRQEALRGAVALLGENYDTFLDKYTAGMEGATEASRDIQLESARAQFDLLKSSIQELGVEVGDVLLPLLLDLVEDAKPVVESVKDWIKENPELTKQILMIGLGLIVLGPLLGIVGTGLSLVGGLVRGVAMAMSFALGPWGLVIAAGILLGVVIYDLGEALGIDWGEVLEVMVNAFELAFERIQQAIQLAIDTYTTFKELLTIGGMGTRTMQEIAAGEYGAEAQQAYYEAMGTPNLPITATEWGQPSGGGGIGGIGSTTLAEIAAGKYGLEAQQAYYERTGQPVPQTNIEQVTIHANSESEGRAAARGFEAEMERLRRYSG